MRHNGEIINADAMQMYEGLPIMTNKISQEQQRGVPHHLLGTIPLDEKPWTMAQFKPAVLKLQDEIRSRGRLPIVVGGSHYYINSLLFKDFGILDDVADSEPVGSFDQARYEEKFPILKASAEEMVAKLREVDPDVSLRWHPNDVRKIQKSLRIYLTTGKRPSDLFAEQQARKASSLQGSWETLILWVYATKCQLMPRLDARVDKMVNGGLLAETSELFESWQKRAAAGDAPDQSTGIWQSIGYKQLEPYHKAVRDTASSAELERLREIGITRTKSATRNYVRGQIRWIAGKMLPGIKAYGALDKLFLLDSSDTANWQTEVVEKADGLVHRFLIGQSLPLPGDLSETARQVLGRELERGLALRQAVPCQKTCPLCESVFLTEHQWEAHLQGQSHRQRLRREKKKQEQERRAMQRRQQKAGTALVVVSDPDSDTEPIGLTRMGAYP